MSEDSLTGALSLGDKGFEDFIPTFDHPGTEFFDQYVTHDYNSVDPSDTSNNSNGSYFFDTDFSSFDMEQSSGSSIVDSSSSSSSKSQQQPINAWQRDSWRYNKVGPVPQTQKLVHHNRPDGLAITGTELLSLEGKIPSKAPTFTTASLPPRTPPATPDRSKPYQSSPGSVTLVTPRHRSHRISKAPYHISNVSANMESPYTGQDSPSFWEWTGRFQQFNLGIPSDSLPLSPPPSGKAPSFDQPTRFSTPLHGERDDTANEPIPTPTLRRDSRTVSRNHARHPSGISTNPYPTLAPQDPFQLPQVTSQPYQWLTNLPDEEETDFLCSPLQPQNPWTVETYAQPSSSNAYVFSSLDEDFASQGLMIQTGDVEYADFLSPTTMSSSNTHFSEEGSYPFETTTSSTGRTSRPRYQTRPSPPTLRPLSPPAPTRSSHAPHPTPTRRSSRPNMGISSSSSSSTSLHHRRTKSSIHSSSSSSNSARRIGGPSRTPTHVKSAPSLSSSSQHLSSTHLLPSSSSPTTTGTTSSPSIGGNNNNNNNSNIGFVNFTPSDSKRILTGVAPSGSSKTKARREKEAGEKRRKLSEVAMRAMQEVGAKVDVDRLREEGLLV